MHPLEFRIQGLRSEPLAPRWEVPFLPGPHHGPVLGQILGIRGYAVSL